MNYLWQGFVDAIRLILTFDSELVWICLVSIRVSLCAIILATLAGVPLGLIIGTSEFYGKRLVTIFLNTLMALPTVVVGLFIYSLISRSGPLGSLGLLYTPAAMITGQFILATPIIAALTLSAVKNTDSRVRMTALTLGASGWQVRMTVLSESRYAIMAALIAGFGRIFAEVGVSMMLGGNIKLYTRNITTAIAFWNQKGEFALGLALGIILLFIAFMMNVIFHWFQSRMKD